MGAVVIICIVIIVAVIAWNRYNNSSDSATTSSFSSYGRQSQTSSSKYTAVFLNSKKSSLYNKCKQIISANELSEHPSCQKDILDVLKAAFETSDDSVFPTSPEEIEMRAYILLAHTTFDLLSSGKYHMYRGVLNPNSPAQNLKQVYRAAMKYALTQGEIDQETLIDQENFLNEKIAEIG